MKTEFNQILYSRLIVFTQSKCEYSRTRSNCSVLFVSWTSNDFNNNAEQFIFLCIARSHVSGKFNTRNDFQSYCSIWVNSIHYVKAPLPFVLVNRKSNIHHQNDYNLVKKFDLEENLVIRLASKIQPKTEHCPSHWAGLTLKSNHFIIALHGMVSLFANGFSSTWAFL